MIKKHVLDFLRRGLTAWGLGPVILAVLYLFLHHRGLVETLTVSQVCIGIFSLSALAFVAGGMNFIYQIEQLPLMVAILIHGVVLYAGYLATYLVNNWLEQERLAIFVFSGIFAAGYLVIWTIIYGIIRINTHKINKLLKKQHEIQDSP